MFDNIVVSSTGEPASASSLDFLLLEVTNQCNLDCVIAIPSPALKARNVTSWTKAQPSSHCIPCAPQGG